MAKRPGRVRNQLPHCYYEGYMEKRSFKDKTSRKLWTCLCGNMLFFFNNSKDAAYVERLDLNNFISITDDCSRDRKLDAARLILRLKDEDTHLTAPSLEARELWKGFIYSVVQLSVPSSLNLLPGQIHMLKETIKTEKERMQAISPPPAAPSPTFDNNIYVIPVGDMPACYHHVSRTEAELMLERHHDGGNLLLRPGRDGTSFAITTRQEMNGSVFRHYRVARKHDGSFAIDVDQPIICATLHDVISSMVKKTGGTMTPFIMDGTYDENIMLNICPLPNSCDSIPSSVFVQSDEENGEKSVQSALSDSSPPQVPCPPRPGTRMPEPEFEKGEKLYLNDTWTEKEKELVVRPPVPFRLPVLNICPLPDSSNSCDSIPSSGLERKAPKQALMPPAPVLRNFTLPSSSADNLGPATAPRTFTRPSSSSTDNLGPAAALRTISLASSSADNLGPVTPPRRLSSADNLGPATAPRTFTLPSSSTDNLGPASAPRRLSSADNLGPASAPRRLSSTDNLGPATAPRTFTLPSSSTDNLGPTAAPRTISLASSSADNQDGRMRRLTVGSVSQVALAQNIAEELRQKLEKRGMMS